MASQSLETFLLALKQGREFIPIQVSSLRLDTVTNFDLFIHASPGEPAVLYADRSLPFDEKSRGRLEDNQIKFLYIHSDQLNDYRKYIESNMSAILTDAGIRLDEKSRLLHITAQGVVQNVLDGGDLSEGLERGSQLVSHTVDFLFGHRTALRHLVESASVNYELYSHSVNVCVMGLALAQRMGFSADRLIEFGMGALFRDVGMAKISPDIVHNTGPLTVEQYDEVKRHPALGVEMLQDCGVTAEGTLDIVLHHHEKLDGSGYPDGLEGDELSPFVRICTVVDIFDALTTNRVHKKSVGTYEALQVMSQEMQGELDLNSMKAMITMLGFSKGDT